MQKGLGKQAQKCKPETGWKGSLSSSWVHNQTRASPQLIKTEEKNNVEKKKKVLSSQAQTELGCSFCEETEEEGLELKQRELGLLLLAMEGRRLLVEQLLPIPSLHHHGQGQHFTLLMLAEPAGACATSARNHGWFKLLPFSHPPILLAEH